MSKKFTKRKNLKNKPGINYQLSGYFLIIAVCFVIPIMYFQSTLDPVFYPRFTAVGIMVFMLSIIVFLESKTKNLELHFLKNIYFFVFGLFIILSLLSLVVAINPIEGLTDVSKWMMFFMFTVLASFLIIENNSLFNILLKGLILNAILFSVFGIWLFFEKAYLNTDPNALYEVKGLMAHKNQFSISMFVLLPFLFSGFVFLKKNWQKISLVASLLVIILILILQTRAVWMAIGFSFVISGIILLIINARSKRIQLKNITQKKIVVAGISFIIVILAMIVFFPIGPLQIINERLITIFNPAYTSNEWRIEMWNSTYELALANGFKGVGAGNWKISIYPFYSEFLPSVYRHWRNPHNDYLLVWAEKGLPGLLSFIGMFSVLLYLGIRNMVRAGDLKSLVLGSFLIFGVIGYMIISFFSFPNERISHFLIISLMAALIISKGKNKSMLVRKAFLVLPILVGSYFIIHFGMLALNSEINVKKSQIAADQKKWEVMDYYAVKAGSKWAPIEPKSSFPVLMYAGIANFEMKNYTKALGYFKKSYRKDPNNISLLNNLGSVYGVLEMYDSAVYYHKKTLEIFPHHEEGLLNLSKTYYFNNDFEKAFQWVLYCDPKSSNTEVSQLRNVIEEKLR